MSLKRRQLQDEAAKLASQIEELRAVAPKDDAEAATIAERIDDAAKRAEQIEPELARESALDARLRSLRSTVTDACEHRDALVAKETPTVERAEAAAIHGFGSRKEAREVGLALRSLMRGETRAMGETSTTYDLKGSEYVVTQLYNAVINILQYQSIAFQVASTFETQSNRITFPKVGEIVATPISENTDTTDTDISTSGATCNVLDWRSSVAVSNNLIEDSPVDVAGLVASRLAYGYAKSIDKAWLQGYSSGGVTIGGLHDGIVAYGSGSNVVTVAKTANTTVANFADIVGKIDPYAINPSWVVGAAGWAEIMKVSATLLNANIVNATTASLWGSTVRKAYNMPANVYAIYGDFNFTTAIATKPAGLQITAARELLIKKNATLFVGIQRFGILNHAPEFGASLVKATV
jgi:HK97 family phage major capsid protein